MMPLTKIISRKTILLIIILCVQQVSLVFSYSAEEIRPVIGTNIVQSLPLFVPANIDGYKIYQLNPYFQDEVERCEAGSSGLPEKIMTEGIRSERFLAYYLNKHNSKIKFGEALNIAGLYIEEAKKEGVNHDIAFTQMCLETGFLKFSGTVKADQNNFCGLGAVNKFERGERFSSVKSGIRAHIQHLKAYADKGHLNSEQVDKRFKYISRGSAQTVQDLTGKWAEDAQYGDKIENMLKELYSL